MALTNDYDDAYLAPLVTEATEARAEEQVADLGTLPANWVTRLTVVKAYIITCVEKMRAPDDVFAAKLKAYRAQWDEDLRMAKAAQAVADAEAGGVSGGGSFFTVELRRA